MRRTTEVNDQDLASEAAKILGTTTLRDIIDLALREVVNVKRRLELPTLLSKPDRFDFDTVEDAWGGVG